MSENVYSGIVSVTISLGNDCMSNPKDHSQAPYVSTLQAQEKYLHISAQGESFGQ